MPKIKLKKQDNYEFEYKTTLQVTDINYGGHLGNDTLVGITHEARVNLLRALGFSELDLGDGKTGIIMADLAINYLGEGFMFDEITVYSHIDEISSASYRIFHYIASNEKTIALAETGIIAFDYNERCIVEIPKSFIEALNNFCSKEGKSE
jgi:acyl-CoA thioester hydrolase